VLLLGLVEVQGAGQGVENAVGSTGEVAAFELGVVLNADPGQVGDLAAAQPGHAAVAVEVLQSGLLGADLGAARAEEGFNLVTVVHVTQARPNRDTEWCAVSTPLQQHLLRTRGAVS
jgi:hypothetical protein